MNSTNKKSPATRGVPQPQSLNNKQPKAPAVFRPESATRTAVQPKAAGSVVNRKTPVAPPAYRPQPVPKVLQTKRSPAAPPISRPATRIVQAFRLSSVVQRMEEEQIPVATPKLPPCTYNTIKGENPWHDEKALAEHCFTYCDSKEKKIWVMFAYCVGFPPPELGHGSQLQEVTPKGNKAKGKSGAKQGSAKDEVRWTKFHNCMKLVVIALGLNGKSDFQKADKFVKQFGGETPDWW